MSSGRLDADAVVALLGLEPLAQEGGHFRRTWTSPDPDVGSRPAGTAIYFLLSPGPEGFSALHSLDRDEVYHFYAGDPVELHLIEPGGRHRREVLGSDLAAGQRPQAVVPAGVLQGSRLVGDGAWALLGTTMAPGFVPEAFILPERRELLDRYPELSELIRSLTR